MVLDAVVYTLHPTPWITEMPVSSVVPEEPYTRSEGLDRLLGRIEPDVACLLGEALEGREGRVSMLLRPSERDLFR